MGRQQPMHVGTNDDERVPRYPTKILALLLFPISCLLSTPRLFSKIGGPLPPSHHRASTSVQNSELTWLLCVAPPPSIDCSR